MSVGTLRKVVLHDGDEWPSDVLKFDTRWSNGDELVVWYVDRPKATPFRRVQRRGGPCGP